MATAGNRKSLAPPFDVHDGAAWEKTRCTSQILSQDFDVIKTAQCITDGRYRERLAGARVLSCVLFTTIGPLCVRPTYLFRFNRNACTAPIRCLANALWRIGGRRNPGGTESPMDHRGMKHIDRFLAPSACYVISFREVRTRPNPHCPAAFWT